MQLVSFHFRCKVGRWLQSLPWDGQGQVLGPWFLFLSSKRHLFVIRERKCLLQANLYYNNLRAEVGFQGNGAMDHDSRGIRENFRVNGGSQGLRFSSFSIYVLSRGSQVSIWKSEISARMLVRFQELENVESLSCFNFVLHLNWNIQERAVVHLPRHD